MKPMITCLLFKNEAEAAAKFYTSVFKGKLGGITYFGDEGRERHGGKKGQVLAVEFKINGTKFVAVNGARPDWIFTEAMSFQILCNSQKEIDFYWKKLIQGGGQESYCGWLKDKFGVSWQVTPPLLMKLLKDKDRKKADRVMKAMLTMRKINIAAIKEAAK